MTLNYDENNLPLMFNTIELLGFAKNNIVEVQNKEKDLPLEYAADLKQAYCLLDKIQEYLYRN